MQMICTWRNDYTDLMISSCSGTERCPCNSSSSYAASLLVTPLLVDTVNPTKRESKLVNLRTDYRLVKLKLGDSLQISFICSASLIIREKIVIDITLKNFENHFIEIINVSNHCCVPSLKLRPWNIAGILIFIQINE